MTAQQKIVLFSSCSIGTFGNWVLLFVYHQEGENNNKHQYNENSYRSRS